MDREQVNADKRGFLSERRMNRQDAKGRGEKFRGELREFA